jgi:molybdenum cofactor biosynthesis enzyme MoaA
MEAAKFKIGKTTNGLLLKLLQDDFRPRLKRVVKKLGKGNYKAMPFAALVDLTTRCNLGCSWCYNGPIILYTF